MSRDVEACLPHRGPALLIEQILEDREGLSVCRARVPPDSPFRAAEGGRAVVPTYLAFEMGV
jgi:predicted hotdog family 3-hydroxylacyl-ACP dehydratase